MPNYFSSFQIIGLQIPITLQKCRAQSVAVIDTLYAPIVIAITKNVLIAVTLQILRSGSIIIDDEYLVVMDIELF